MLMQVVNWFLYLGFCVLTGTGLLLAFRLLPGSRGGQGLEFYGWGRHDWGDVHFWVACGVIALAVVHLILNWAWVKKVAIQGRNWRMLAGLGVGLVLVLAFVVLPVRRQEGGEQEPAGQRQGWRGGRH
jgi:hypothetical protein